MSFEIENGILEKYIPESGETEVVIPVGVTSIGNYAFSFCRKVTSIAVPDGVTSIGNGAFWACTRLTDITIPNGVTSIGDRAFDGCNSLTSIAIPDGVTSIGESAFSGCSSLTDIVIPNSVTCIGNGTFSGCSSLTDIVIPDSVDYVDNRAFERDSVPKTIIAKPDMLTDSRWKTVAVMTFLGSPERFSPGQTEACKKYLCLQKKWLLPEILRSDIVHAMYVFAEKGEITKSNVESDFLNPAIKAGATQCVAFLMDWENKNVTPEDKEKMLGEERNKDPFNAADMKKIWSSKKLADGTLSLTSYKNTDTDIVIPERIGKNRVTCLDNRLFSVEKPGRLFAQKEVLENITSVTIPSGLTKIGMSVFRGCTKLQVVAIPETVKSIGRYAFLDCSKSLTIHAPLGSFAAEYAKKNKIQLEIDRN